MTVRILFPRLLVIVFALSFVAGVAAQTEDPDGRPRYAVTNRSAVRLETTDIVAVPAPASARHTSAVLGRFNSELLSAIESHLGATYHYNTTGPDTFDCSGFVWRAFQDAGVNFQRGPARSYWASFAAPQKDEQFKFGTLVFFSGLSHVGIVADEKGFYHSSRHHGVVYSPFNEYWLSRIDGFRQVPLTAAPSPVANHKPRTKPVTNVESDEDNAP